MPDQYSTSVTSSPTEALHHRSYAMTPDPQATHSLCRVLTTDLPAGLCLQGMDLTGVDLQVGVGGCDSGDRFILVDSAAPRGTWCWVRSLL